MNTPKELMYTKSHEWIKMKNDTTAIVGLTDFAQDAMGDIVFVNLPQAGDSTIVEEVFADVESVKAVSDIFSPFTGVVSKVNEALLDGPEAINSAPYDAWLVEIADITDHTDLLTAEQYEEVCAKEG